MIRGVGMVRAADPVVQLHKEIEYLREQMKKQREFYEKRLGEMQKQIDRISPEKASSSKSGQPAGTTEGDLEKLVSETGGEEGGLARSLGSVQTFVQSMNPDLSVNIDAAYYNDDSDGGFKHILHSLSGFGHSHGPGGHTHSHGVFDRGFNLREVEVAFSAEVDPYFKGYAMVSFSEAGSEIEEAVVQTTSLPWGTRIKGGKFLSDFGRINSKHPHAWDFVDKPLVYQQTMGYHGIDDVGVQFSWLAPTPFQLLFGVEAFQGKNETMFNYLAGNDENLPSHDGPRLWLGWLKLAPELPYGHGIRLGAFGGTGKHQEAHDGNTDGVNDHWFDGDSYFAGCDFVYKYEAGQMKGLHDFKLAGEYLWRKKDLDMVKNTLKPWLAGNDKIDRQDGYYLQGVYGFYPRWRAGLRWEQIGLVNSVTFPDGLSEDYGATWRASGMMDFSPSEFSRLRFQVANGDYVMSSGRENVWQFFVQAIISLGTHGAHKW